MTRARSKKVRTGLLYVVVAIAALANVFPVLWAFLTSIKPPNMTFSVPPTFVFRPTLDSYRLLFGEGHHAMAIDMPRLMTNSLMIALTAALVTVTSSALAAYSLSRFQFRGKTAIAFIIIATRMLPPIASAIPIFLIVNRLGLHDTHFALILTYTAVNIPFAVWMLRGFMDEVPIDLEESAMVDGASRRQALFSIVLPLVAPGVAATAVFGFLLAWNDFALALVLTQSNARTVPLIIMSFLTDAGVLWGPMAAAATLILLPPVVFSVIAQRHLTKGLTMGAVKG